MIHALIIDDMKLARQRLRRYLADESGIEIIGECQNGREAIESIRSQKPDLIFLDVQMPEVDGFQVLEEIGTENAPVIIFVTAFDQFALKAFDFHAIDYLLKPFDKERLSAALSKAKKMLENNQSQDEFGERLQSLLNEVKPSANFIKRLAIKSNSRTIFLTVDEIDWIGAAGNYLELHAGKKTHLLREKMSEIEAKLDPVLFVRIHRSTIVNLHRIREMHPLFKGDQLLILSDGTELTVSRTFRENLIAALEGS